MYGILAFFPSGRRGRRFESSHPDHSPFTPIHLLELPHDPRPQPPIRRFRRPNETGLTFPGDGLPLVRGQRSLPRLVRVPCETQESWGLV